jgi:hypothetical protein
MLELGRCHLRQIRSGIESGNYIDALDEGVASKVKVADWSNWLDTMRMVRHRSV